MPERATGRDIVFEILKNMRESAEPLTRDVLVPGVYNVYLHIDDHTRLAAIQGDIATDAKQALENEIDRLNQLQTRKPFDRLKEMFRGGTDKLGDTLPYRKPVSGWQIIFHIATEAEFLPGDIEVHSQFAHIVKTNRGGQETVMTEMRQGTGTTRTGMSPKSRQPVDSPPAEERTHIRDSGSIPFAQSGVRPFAVLRYESKTGLEVLSIRKDNIVIGRGGPNCWVDFRIIAPFEADTKMVSSEHIRLRRDPTTGKFFIKDTSSNGTTVNGQRIPPSLDNGTPRRDRNVEVPLPESCRIGLADVVFLEFEVCQ